MHEHGSGTCLSSLLIGAFAGAGLAMVLAPRAGSETRPLVSRKVREDAESARELASRAKERGRQLAEAAVEKGGDAAESIEGGAAAPPAREYSSAVDDHGL